MKLQPSYTNVSIRTLMNHKSTQTPDRIKHTYIHTHLYKYVYEKKHKIDQKAGRYENNIKQFTPL